MPQELKPCPACGGQAIPVKLGARCWCECEQCETRGPVAGLPDAAATAWNSLPRRFEITPNDADCKGCPARRWRLLWSHKPPAKPGELWFYQSPQGKVSIVSTYIFNKANTPLFATFLSFKGDSSHPEGFERVETMPGQWAGPIHTPKEASKDPVCAL